MQIIPQSAAMGAEIRGVDLTKKLPAKEFEQVNQVLLDYQIIFFRDQDLSHKQYIDFGNCFGELKDYMFADGIDGYPLITEIVKTEDETESFGSYWHSDSTFLERPPKATILLARQVPPRGGDTLFSDMYAAYDELSEGMKTVLASLNAIGSASVFSRNEDLYHGVKSKNSDKETQQAIHPVIRTHDETGKKALYVNTIHTLCFEGMTREESMPMLNYLYDLAARPEYSFRLGWELNTLAVWDNRCAQHYALNDYHGHRRVMHRLIVEGDRPK